MMHNFNDRLNNFEREWDHLPNRRLSLAEIEWMPVKYLHIYNVKFIFKIYDWPIFICFIIFTAEWWLNYGSSSPILRKIAIRVLSQTSSSSGCERNWSTFALIHTKIRNRLTHIRLDKLVYVHYNMRLRLKHLQMDAKKGEGDYDPTDLAYLRDDEDPIVSWISKTTVE